MRSGEKTTLASYRIPIANTLRSYGVDPEEIFSAVGLSVDHENSIMERMTVDQVAKLFQYCVDKTGDEYFALKASEFMTVSLIQPLGYSLLASLSIRDFFDRLTRYLSMVTATIKMRGEECLDYYRVCYYDINPNVSPYTMDAWNAYIIKFIRRIYLPDFHPAAITIAREHPDVDITPYNDYFGIPVKFDKDDGFIAISYSDLDQKLINGNTTIALANDAVVQEYITRIDEADIKNKVSIEITKQLSAGRINKTTVAKSLGMSPRSLQNKLNEQGVTYQEILDYTRKQLAISYLNDKSMNVNQIAYLLNYSESSTFVKVFKKWTNYTPVDFRNLSN